METAYLLSLPCITHDGGKSRVHASYNTYVTVYIAESFMGNEKFLGTVNLPVRPKSQIALVNIMILLVGVHNYVVHVPANHP